MDKQSDNSLCLITLTPFVDQEVLKQLTALREEKKKEKTSTQRHK